MVIQQKARANDVCITSYNVSLIFAGYVVDMKAVKNMKDADTQYHKGRSIDNEGLTLRLLV